MAASISTLPVWKKGTTPAEWLEELAAMAREHPERWARIVVIFEEADERGRSAVTRHYERGIDYNTDLLGTLETTKLQVYDYMLGRRDG